MDDVYPLKKTIVRAARNPYSQYIAGIQLNQAVTVHDIRDGWAYVSTRSGEEGYVPVEDLDIPHYHIQSDPEPPPPEPQPSNSRRRWVIGGLAAAVLAYIAGQNKWFEGSTEPKSSDYSTSVPPTQPPPPTTPKPTPILDLKTFQKPSRLKTDLLEHEDYRKLMLGPSSDIPGIEKGTVIRTCQI